MKKTLVVILALLAVVAMCACETAVNPSTSKDTSSSSSADTSSQPAVSQPAVSQPAVSQPAESSVADASSQPEASSEDASSEEWSEPPVEVSEESYVDPAAQALSGLAAYKTFMDGEGQKFQTGTVFGVSATVGSDKLSGYWYVWYNDSFCRVRMVTFKKSGMHLTLNGSDYEADILLSIDEYSGGYIGFNKNAVLVAQDSIDTVCYAGAVIDKTTLDPAVIWSDYDKALKSAIDAANAYATQTGALPAGTIITVGGTVAGGQLSGSWFAAYGDTLVPLTGTLTKFETDGGYGVTLGAEKYVCDRVCTSSKADGVYFVFNVTEPLLFNDSKCTLYAGAIANASDIKKIKDAEAASAAERDAIQKALGAFNAYAEEMNTTGGIILNGLVINVNGKLNDTSLDGYWYVYNDGNLLSLNGALVKAEGDIITVNGNRRKCNYKCTSSESALTFEFCTTEKVRFPQSDCEFYIGQVVGATLSETEKLAIATNAATDLFNAYAAELQAKGQSPYIGSIISVSGDVISPAATLTQAGLEGYWFVFDGSALRRLASTFEVCKDEIKITVDNTEYIGQLKVTSPDVAGKTYVFNIRLPLKTTEQGKVYAGVELS